MKVVPGIPGTSQYSGTFTHSLNSSILWFRATGRLAKSRANASPFDAGSFSVRFRQAIVPRAPSSASSASISGLNHDHTSDDWSPLM
jgi:hypothetical protein